MTVAVVLGSSLFTAVGAHAASDDIHVDCTVGEPGDGSSAAPYDTLAAAVDRANGAAGADTIRIAAGLCVVGDLPVITEGLTITGAGNDASSGTLLEGAALSASGVDLTVVDLVIDAAGTGAAGIEFA